MTLTCCCWVGTRCSEGHSSRRAAGHQAGWTQSSAAPECNLKLSAAATNRAATRKINEAWNKLNLFAELEKSIAIRAKVQGQLSSATVFNFARHFKLRSYGISSNSCSCVRMNAQSSAITGARDAKFGRKVLQYRG